MNSASRAHTTKKGKGSFRRPFNGRMFSDDEVVTWDGVDYPIRDRDWIMKRDTREMLQLSGMITFLLFPVFGTVIVLTIIIEEILKALF